MALNNLERRKNVICVISQNLVAFGAHYHYVQERHQEMR